MADVAIAVRTYLLTKTAITDAIGTRIWTDMIPQGGALPAVEFSKLTTRHDHTLSGSAGLAHVRLQFDCKADRAAGGRTKANEVAELIRACGILSLKEVVASIDIRGVRIEEGQRNEVEYAEDGSDDHVYVTSFDLEIDFLESI